MSVLQHVFHHAASHNRFWGSPRPALPHPSCLTPLWKCGVMICEHNPVVYVCTLYCFLLLPLLVVQSTWKGLGQSPDGEAWGMRARVQGFVGVLNWHEPGRAVHTVTWPMGMASLSCLGRSVHHCTSKGAQSNDSPSVLQITVVHVHGMK